MARQQWLAATIAVTVLVGFAASAFAAPRRLGYVVDGDTVRLRSGTYVRFIGVDAPEVDACGGKRSTCQLEHLVSGTIRLKRPPGYDNTDRYGRLLRYVHDRS